MPTGANNPRPLLQVAPASSKLDRSAPRISFAGDLIGIGVRDVDSAQVLYRRATTFADSSIMTVLSAVKTDSSSGVCTNRNGITAFELTGKLTSAGALTAFDVYTTTVTATGAVADCGLNVLGFVGGSTKILASGVDTVAAFGDHKVGYLYAGALFEVDLMATSKVPRLLADNGLPAGSLLGAVNPTAPIATTATPGTPGAIEAAAIYVLTPAGVLSRYTYGAPPLAASVDSPATTALAGADGLVVADDATLFVTVGGVLKKVTVTNGATLTLAVAVRDYAAVGPLAVTLGASTVAGP
jgi:hypothetical protein